MAKRNSTEQFIQEAQKVLDGKYDYSKVNYVNNNTKYRKYYKYYL